MALDQQRKSLDSGRKEVLRQRKQLAGQEHRDHDIEEKLEKDTVKLTKVAKSATEFGWIAVN